MVDVPSKGYQPIENYGIIGDLYTVALVGMDGSIDFMAFPHFDSPTVFAALLDWQKGGRFQIAPRLTDARQKQLYLPDSNILLTRFLAADGVAEISDCMPVEEVEQAHNLVRRVKTVPGEIGFRMLCAPRFDYGRASHRVEQRDGEVLFFSEGTDRLVLRLYASVPLRLQNGDAIAEFTLRADENAAFVLEWARAGEDSPTLAPDYVPRTWIRDASFTLYALSRLGYPDEMATFMRWIEARCGELAPDGALQVMYGIDGRHLLTEERLVHWEGYQQSTPVRIGNGAYNQLQLDIYGEFIDAVYLYNKYGAPISHDLWMNLTRLLNWICDHWHLPFDVFALVCRVPGAGW